jgi:F-type H+-transporting ATPase subunit gamma
MKRAISIHEELDQIKTVEGLTGVFESIASIKIAKLRNRVIASKEYFDELWQTYRGLRVDPKDHLKRADKKKNDHIVLVAITSEGKLSGEVDTQVIAKVAEAYGASKDPSLVDVVVLGTHGASQLEQLGVVVTQRFQLPAGDVQFSVGDIIEKLEEYNQISVFYETYESLRVQKVQRIELVNQVLQLGDKVEGEGEADKVEIMSAHEYIFEPSVNEIADYLESLMLGVALTQVIMESKLAQYAARFNAMHSAKTRANEIGTEYNSMYHRAKRFESDERLKEIMTVAMNITGEATA